MSRQEKAEELRKLILALHAGEPLEGVKARFDVLIEGVSPEEIAAMEQQLIHEGMPVAEVQRLCDLHVGVVRDGLDVTPDIDVPPGHPVHTYMGENREFEKLADRLIQASDVASFTERLDALSVIEVHYLRKENQLFPYLEKHGVSGPTQVMWGIHDEIRAALRSIKDKATSGNLAEAKKDAVEVARTITEMIYKEEKILFPLAMEKLSSTEWSEMRLGDDEIGYAFEAPREWSPATQAVSTPDSASPEGTVSLSTGQLTQQQLDRMLIHLPVDLSFVDPEGQVRFYSDNPDRIFPRSPAVIGRSVANCHPPQSVDAVLRILDAFKEGSRETAKFWLQLGERFLLIQYFAVRSEGGDYLGCLEVSQDVTDIRSLEGEQRLLDWE
jgi:uncharacterized protein